MSLPRGSRCLEGWEAGPAPVHASQPGRIKKQSEIWTED